MRFHRDDDGSLRLSSSSTVVRGIMLAVSGGTVAFVLPGQAPLTNWWAWMWVGTLVGAPAGFAFWVEDAAWEFDRGRRVARWSKSRLIGGASGEVPFDAIHGVRIETTTNYEDYAKAPLAYRVALATREGGIPLTQGYGDRREAEGLAAAVREALGLL